MSDRFVILKHDYPTLHWDLLLEYGDVCRTWRLLSEPTTWPLEAESIGDHRKHYLTYEGPVSGGRGTVSRWDAGNYVLHAQAESRWEITLHGQRLSGRFVLEKTAASHWQGIAAVDSE